MVLLKSCKPLNNKIYSAYYVTWIIYVCLLKCYLDKDWKYLYNMHNIITFSFDSNAKAQSSSASGKSNNGLFLHFPEYCLHNYFIAGYILPENILSNDCWFHVFCPLSNDQQKPNSSFFNSILPFWIFNDMLK